MKPGALYIVSGLVLMPVFRVADSYFDIAGHNWKWAMIISPLLIIYGVNKAVNYFADRTRAKKHIYTVRDEQVHGLFTGMLLAPVFTGLALLPAYIWPVEKSSIDWFLEWTGHDIGMVYFWPFIIMAGFSGLMVFYSIFGLLFNEAGSITVSQSYKCPHCGENIPTKVLPADSYVAFKCPNCEETITSLRLY